MEKTYACDQCDEKFRFPNSLKLHKDMKHAEVLSHFCSICGKGFCLKTRKDQHEQTHLAEKSNICEYCGKTFALANYVQNHIRRMHSLEADHPVPKLVKSEEPSTPFP